MSQRKTWEQGVPNCILVAVLLVEFSIEGDLSMKDATCQVNSESQILILPREYYTRTFAMLTTSPSLLASISFLAGRSIGSTSGTSSCPLPRWRAGEGQVVGLRAAQPVKPNRLLLDTPSPSPSSVSNSTCARRVALLKII